MAGLPQCPATTEGEEMTDRFTFFSNFKEAADKLPDDLRLKFYDALTDYVFKGVEPEDPIIAALVHAVNPVGNTGAESLTWGGSRCGCGRKKKSSFQDELEKNQDFKMQLEKLENLKKNQDELEKLENEQKETKEKKNAPLTIPQEENKNNKNNTPIYTSSRCSDVCVPPPEKKFKKPTVDEVEAYCRERQNNVDAGKFWDFYEAKGWKVGKSPMKDWRSAVRTWEREDVRKPVERVFSGRGVAFAQPITDEMRRAWLEGRI